MGKSVAREKHQADGSLKRATHRERTLPDFGESRPKSTRALWFWVYEALRSAILSQNLTPGTKLPEDEIGNIYSVSRTVVRAALQALFHDRLVHLAPKRVAFVAQPSKQEARDVFEARALIEPVVAIRAAEVATASHGKLLQRHLADEDKTMEEGADGEAILLSARFHVTVAEIAGQTVYTELLRTLCWRSALIISMHWTRRDAFCDRHAHHDLVEAITGHRPAEAAELMKSHLVDLLSGLDLRAPKESGRSLADILSETKSLSRRR